MQLTYQYADIEPRYRHQLNHNSKQTYHCTFPNCTRTFVRGDLLKRHMDRHAAKGSQLNQRDTMAGHMASPIAPGQPPSFSRNNSIDYGRPQQTNAPYQPPQVPTPSPYSPMGNPPNGMYQNGNVPNGMDSYMSPTQGYDNRTPQLSQPQSPSVSQRPSISASNSQYNVMSPVANQQGFSNQHQQNMGQNNFVSQQNVMPMNLPPAQYSNGQNSTAVTSAEYSEPGTTQATEMMMLDQMAMPATVPVFGEGGDLNKSPYVGMPEDFMAYLFNSPSQAMTPVMGPNYTKLVAALVYVSDRANPSLVMRNCKATSSICLFWGLTVTRSAISQLPPSRLWLSTIFSINRFLKLRYPRRRVKSCSILSKNDFTIIHMLLLIASGSIYWRAIARTATTCLARE